MGICTIKDKEGNELSDRNTYLINRDYNQVLLQFHKCNWKRRIWKGLHINLFIRSGKLRRNLLESNML